MLEALRQNSKNTIIYILFGVIIAVFVVNFGPGSHGCEGKDIRSFAARVAGSSITEQEYQYAFFAQGFNQYPPELLRQHHLREYLMDKLIERELLAQEAERHGFEVSDQEAEDNIKEGRFMILGVPRHEDQLFKDGVFDYKRLQLLCENRLGVDVKHFIQQQKRELLADKMRQLLLAGSKVTPDEVKQAFELRGTQVNFEYALFPSHRYLDEVAVLPADVDAYRKSHEAEIKKSYEARADLYQKQERQVHVRKIVVNAKSDAEAAKAKSKVDEAAKRIKAGESFATVASAISDDAHTKLRGGDAGWLKKGLTGLGPVVEAKIFGAKDGELVGPERTDAGYALIKVEGIRQGDLTLDQVAGEIAEEQVRTEKAKERARAEADKVLARMKAGEKLEDILPKPSDSDEKNPLKRWNAPPQVKETGLFARQGDIVPQVGLSADLVRALFGGKVGDLLGPVEVSGSSAIGRIKERKDPDVAEFEKHRDDEVRKAEREKWAEVLGAWAHKRCEEVKSDGRIKVNESVLAYEQGAKNELKYEPCAAAKRGGLF